MNKEERHPEEELLKAHPEMLEQLCETLGEDVESPSCDALRAHLDRCPGCRAYVDSLLETIALYRTAGDVKPPAGMKDRLARALHLPE
ncbi:MAG: anti-sigma factor family protein [Bacteroidota bacterium]